MAIYNAYLEGADREAAILDMELNNQYDKLSMLFEMSLMELDQVKRDIEIKVFKESGTYDDLEYLISEAEAQVAQDQTNIISQILQWFANAIQTLFTNIKNFFTGAKNIPDDTEVQVEMNDGEDGMFGEITKILDNVANMDGKITLDNVLKVALSGVAGGGAILAIIDKINKDHPIKTKIVKWAVVKKWNQTTNTLIGKIQGITQSITQKFGDNTVIKSILDNVCKPVMNVLKGVSDRCAAALETAKQKVGDVANNVKNAVTGNNQQANGQAQPQNAAASNNGPATVSGAKTEGHGTGARIVASFVDNTSGQPVTRKAYLTKDGKVNGAGDSKPIPANIKSIIEGSDAVKNAVQRIAKGAEKDAMKNNPQAQLATGTQVDKKAQANKVKAAEDKGMQSQQAQLVQNSAADIQADLGDEYTVEMVNDELVITINTVFECPEDYLSTTQSIFGMVAEEESTEDPDLVELQNLFNEL